jgi:hypothetical protein
MDDGEYTAVIDRIVDDETAVLLCEDDGDVIAQFDVAVDRLPEDTDSGSVLSVTVTDDSIVTMTAVPEETRTRRQRLQETFERLSKRLDDE